MAYDQSGELVDLQPGDRLFIPCEGGPSWTRLVTYPPPLEIPERGGLSVLIDEGATSGRISSSRREF